MNEKTTNAPPERCPICGAERKSSYTGEDYRSYACGAWWLDDEPGHWFTACPYAMNAALRCGATLHPTAREAATLDREELGKVVRRVWVAYCIETNHVYKPDHVDSWEQLDEWAKEVDRRIGEAVARHVLAATPGLTP